MKRNLATSSLNSLTRCTHTYPSGRRCRSSSSAHDSTFCQHHQPKPEELATDALTEAAGTLSTPEEVNRFLTRVTLLRIEGRLTPKEASNYAYLCLILQLGQRAIAFHQKLRDERAEREAEQQARNLPMMGWKLPRPDRSDRPDYVPPPPAGHDPENPSDVEESPLQAYHRLRS